MDGTAMALDCSYRTGYAACLAEQRTGYGMPLGYVELALHRSYRTGFATCLEEQQTGDNPPVRNMEPDYFFTVPLLIAVSGEPRARYLTIGEQRIFQKALRRSVRVVHTTAQGT